MNGQEVKQLFKGEIVGNGNQGSENKNKIYQEEMNLEGCGTRILNQKAVKMGSADNIL